MCMKKAPLCLRSLQLLLPLDLSGDACGTGGGACGACGGVCLRLRQLLRRLSALKSISFTSFFRSYQPCYTKGR